MYYGYTIFVQNGKQYKCRLGENTPKWGAGEIPFNRTTHVKPIMATIHGCPEIGRFMLFCLLLCHVQLDAWAMARQGLAGWLKTNCATMLYWHQLIIIIIIRRIFLLPSDIAPFPYKHAQRRITLHCRRIDVDIHIVNRYIHLWTDVFLVKVIYSIDILSFLQLKVICLI